MERVRRSTPLATAKFPLREVPGTLGGCETTSMDRTDLVPGRWLPSGRFVHVKPPQRPGLGLAGWHPRLGRVDVVVDHGSDRGWVNPLPQPTRTAGTGRRHLC